MKVIAVIQARNKSSRLPGKVLMTIGDKPMIAHVIDRVRLSQYVDDVVVATTDDPVDDSIQSLCDQINTAVFRGAQFDVLDRVYQAVLPYQPGIVVRLTADCPLLDPTLIDDVIQLLIDNQLDFAANRLPPPWKRTFPIGLDVEACTFTGLERAWREAEKPYEREHVMPYFYDEDGRFNIAVLNTEPDYGHLRWTVDTQADLDLVREIFIRLQDKTGYTWKDVLAIVEENPALQQINADVRAKQTQDIDERSIQK